MPLVPSPKPGHPLSPALPANGSRLTIQRDVILLDRNGQGHGLAIEAFDSTHQVPILVWEFVRPSGPRLVVP